MTAFGDIAGAGGDDAAGCADVIGGGDVGDTLRVPRGGVEVVATPAGGVPLAAGGGGGAATAGGPLGVAAGALEALPGVTGKPLGGVIGWPSSRRSGTMRTVGFVLVRSSWYAPATAA